MLAGACRLRPAYIYVAVSATLSSLLKPQTISVAFSLSIMIFSLVYKLYLIYSVYITQAFVLGAAWGMEIVCRTIDTDVSTGREHETCIS